MAVLGGQDPEWLTVGDILERLVFLYDFGVIRPGRSAINDVVNVDTGEVVTDPVLAQTVKDMIDPLRDSFGKTGRGRSHHR